MTDHTAAPRYAEWCALRSNGQWTNGVPDWAKDFSGRMNDLTAASAVIEELAALAQPQQPARWISVEDRMPCDEEIVLVLVPNGRYQKVDFDCWRMQREAPLGFSSATIETGMGWDDHEWEEVTHWMPLPSPPGAHPSQQQDDERDAALHAEWMACETRLPWIVKSLRHRAEEMRAAEKRCRNAYRKDFMGKPAAYVADAFAEAATAFESRLSAMLNSAGEGGK